MRALLFSLLLSLSGLAHGALLSWTAAPLSGANEVPPNASPASGSAFGTYDTVSHVITWNVTFANLTANLADAHIHGAAPPGANAPVIIDFFPGAPGLGTSGAFSGSADLDGDPALTAAFLSQSLAAREGQFTGGLWYVNLHTPPFPAGEIRAQIAVPEPGTLALLAAIGAVLLLGRGKRR